MERHSSNSSRLLYFYEVNQQYCNNDTSSNNGIVYKARLENVDNLSVKGGGAPLPHVSINQTPV